MKVRELMAALIQADPEARVNITVDADHIPEGYESCDLNVMGTADDGDIFDIFTQPHSSVGEDNATLVLNRIIEAALDASLNLLAEQGVSEPAARAAFKEVQKVRDKLTTHDLVWEARS